MALGLDDADKRPCLLQFDAVWFWKYLPGPARRIRYIKQRSDCMLRFITARVQDRRDNLQQANHQEDSDFISAYLREVQKSDGKLDDRCSGHCRISALFTVHTCEVVLLHCA